MLAMLASLALTGLNLRELTQNPLVSAFVDRSGAEIEAAMAREMAREATPERIEARLTDLLTEAPRNWLAITAVELLAAERGIALPPTLLEARAAAYAQDHGFWTRAGKCAACAVDPRACDLSAVLVCQAPMVLTPLGDVVVLGRESGNFMLGHDVDELDLGLSAVGLTAVLLTPATGGTSYMVGIGARGAKLARKMGLMSGKLTAMMTDAVRRGVDWGAVARARGTDDLHAAMRADVLAPVVRTLDDMGRTREVLGTTAALHVLRHVDTPADARLMANAAEAMGPRMLGPLEVLGKSRFLRVTMRLADQVWYAFAGIMAFFSALGSAIASAITGRLRRFARGPARREPPLTAPPSKPYLRSS